LALDIDVRIPGPATVGGRGIESLWKGNLKVSGDAADPRVAGRLTLLRGTLAFGSRSFALTKGEIEFDGGPSIEPRIEIVAAQEEADFTASLTLSGRASAPKITASSVPARPQDEVFAALLFGRSVSSLSALEALELANSISALSGGTDLRGSVIGGLRSRFGLDVLSVDLGEGGNAVVKAGTYLADNIYFELRQGGPNGGTTGRVELQIDENISVETEVGPQSSSSVGARYKLDY
jgi:translocation and assembly module TamB